jgi:molecular chaperone GrpE
MTNPEPLDIQQEPETTPEPLPAGDAALLAAKAEAADWKDKCLRAVADAENARKRAERDVSETQKYAVSNFARDLVGVAETLKMALESVNEDALANADPLLKTVHSGVEMTLKELLSTFERFGIKRIDPMGQKFDHNLHQAIAQVDAPHAEAGSVVQVVQAGYTIADRLLRPAMVAVAKAESSPKPSVDTVA